MHCVAPDYADVQGLVWEGWLLGEIYAQGPRPVFQCHERSCAWLVACEFREAVEEFRSFEHPSWDSNARVQKLYVFPNLGYFVYSSSHSNQFSLRFCFTSMSSSDGAVVLFPVADPDITLPSETIAISF